MSKRVTVIVEGREYIVEVGDLDESPIKATVNNRTYQVDVPRQEESRPASKTVAEMPPAEEKEAAKSSPARDGLIISAPMPGNIIEVKVKAGDSVQPGDVLCVLEAMKMNNMIYADQAGVIASVAVVAGQAVDYGAPLVTFR
jgi:glutaconyl-CoA/methylmalonyl-CoA decarboxylase subunit gamma